MVTVTTPKAAVVLDSLTIVPPLRIVTLSAPPSHCFWKLIDSIVPVAVYVEGVVPSTLLETEL